MVQAVSYQAVLHGFAGGYRSHVVADQKGTIWHCNPRQGAFPSPTDWRQTQTQAYYMTADPWPLEHLMHTISARSRQQEPRWANPSTWVSSPNQEEHLQAAWHGNAICATNVLPLHTGPIAHVRPAATLAVAQSRWRSPM